MKKLSIVIMAHPERAQFIPYLKEKLGDVPVIFDTRNDIWDTCRRAWLAHDFDCEYGIVIQDDAIISNRFHERAESVLKDDFIYSFYFGEMLERRVRQAERDGLDFVMGKTILHEIALCMRMERVKEMVQFGDEREAKTDQIINVWANLKRIPICYPIPSLIDHRDEESIYRRVYKMNLSTKPRKAIRYEED